MALIRKESLTDLDSMQRQMARMMEHVFGANPLTRAGWNLPSLGMQAFVPNVEVYTTDKDVVASVELAGIAPEDVEVEITEDSIHLSGEVKRESEIQDDAYYHSERSYGRFDRVVALPNRIKDAEAKASFKNGLLTIRAPLFEEPAKPQARKLSIEQG